MDNETLYPQLTPTPKSHKRLIILLSILVVVAIGASAYFYFSGSIQPLFSKKTQINSNIATTTLSDWKKYINEKIGFQVQIPKGWIIREGASSTVFLNKEKSDKSVDDDPVARDWAFFRVRKQENANPRLISIEKWVMSLSKSFPTPPIQQESYTVDAHPAYKVEVVEIGNYTHIYVSVNSDIFDISYKNSASQYVDIYKQILSSFKFISPTNAGWRIYQNKEYGFELEYPNNWEIDAGETNKGNFWLKEIGTEPEFGMSTIFIGVEDNKNNSQLANLIKKETILKSYYDPDKNITLGGVEAIQSRVVKPTSPPVTPWDAGWESGLVKETYAIKDGKIFTLYAIGSDFEKVEKVYDQIISTFKFIDTLTPAERVAKLPEINTKIALPDEYYISELEDVGTQFSSASTELRLDIVRDEENLSFIYLAVETYESVKRHFEWCGNIEGEPCMWGQATPKRFEEQKVALAQNKKINGFDLIIINGRSFLVNDIKLNGNIGYNRGYRTLFDDKILEIGVYIEKSDKLNDQQADSLISKLKIEKIK